MERLVNERLKVHLRQFAETPLLAPGAMPAAAAAVERALRRRDLPLAELVCAILAYAITLGGTLALQVSSTTAWLVEGANAGLGLSAAGW